MLQSRLKITLLERVLFQTSAFKLINVNFNIQIAKFAFSSKHLDFIPKCIVATKINGSDNVSDSIRFYSYSYM